MAAIEVVKLDVPDPQRSEKKVHEHYGIQNLNLLDPLEIRAAARVYFDAWNPLGLCDDPNEAIAKIVSFRASDTYLLKDYDDEQILAVLNTLPVKAKNVTEIVAAYPSYESVENQSVQLGITPDKKTPDYILCFSIAAFEEGKHRISVGSERVSTSKYLLENFTATGNARKIAYSRVKGPVGKMSLEEFYYQSDLNADKTPLGPVGMHKKYGAIPIAFLNGSRSEDVSGGGGNILMVYPRDEEEAKYFASIEESRRIMRRHDSPIPQVQVGNHTVYSDMMLV